MDWAREPRGAGTLYVVPARARLPDDARTLYTSNSLDGQSALRLIDLPLATG